MELGSPSRRSWADIVEEDEEALRSTAGSVLEHLPPLAAAAHAAHVLRASSLDPNAEPFPGSPRGRVRFSDSEESSGDSDEPPPSTGRGKAVRRSRRIRRRRRRRNAAGFMADARRAGPQTPPPLRGGFASVVVHPARMSAEPDSDRFHEVHSRRRWRRAVQEVARPVPADLVGKCFYCFATDHVRADCRQPGKCFNCREPGHQARDCPLPRAPGHFDDKRGRSPARAGCAGRGARRRRAAYDGHRASPADIVSARSASTGREPLVPPVCDPTTLDRQVMSE